MGADLNLFNFSDYDSRADMPQIAAHESIARELNLGSSSVKCLMGQANTMALYKVKLAGKSKGDSIHIINANVDGKYGVQEELDSIVDQLKSQLVGTNCAGVPAEQIAQVFLSWLSDRVCASHCDS